MDEVFCTFNNIQTANKACFTKVN